MTDSEAKHGYAVVEWGRERITIPMPAPEEPLLVLKQAIAQKTGIQPEQQTLLWSGFKMKDDRLPLSRYNLYQSQTPVNQKTSISNLMRGFMWSPPPAKRPVRLTLIGSPETSSTVSDRAHFNEKASSAASSSSKLPLANDEASTINNIHTLKGEDFVKLQQRVEALDSLTDAGKRSHECAILSEVLLQLLLKLDSVNIEPEWKDARLQRKAAVKEVQATLDKVDSTKAAANQQT